VSLLSHASRPPATGTDEHGKDAGHEYHNASAHRRVASAQALICTKRFTSATSGLTLITNSR